MVSRKRIFVSYARRDGATFAERLHRDLSNAAFDVWLDTARLKGGDRWTNEIEDALDQCHAVIVVLSGSYFGSEVCRAEHGWALDQGKRVIPVRIDAKCKVPLRLYNLQWIDFTNRADYGDRFHNLVDTLANIDIPRIPEALEQLAPTKADSEEALDNESKERLLVAEVIATVAKAQQISREVTASDYGIDMEIEFKDDSGRATGQKLYLQLKSGGSYLRQRKSDGAEIFAIRKLRHAQYWMNQAFPVMLVIRTMDGRIRWMEVRDWLKRETDDGAREVRQITFQGERFDVASIRQYREKILKPLRPAAAAYMHHNNAPALPGNFVPRPDLLLKLRDAIFRESGKRHVALTAMHGMGGVGKTVLAQALCDDPAVQRAFPDGIFWFTIGREPASFRDRIETVPGIKRLLGVYDSDDGCRSEFRKSLRDKAALIVLDDVWNSRDIESFEIDSPFSRILITTRDADIAPAFSAVPFEAVLLTEVEARNVLARWSGYGVDKLPVQTDDLIRECGYLPLALAMIGAQLKQKPGMRWDELLGQLRGADLSTIRAHFPEPHTSLVRAIDVSFEALKREDPNAARRYLTLAVLLEDMPAAPAVLQTLWGQDPGGATDTAERLIARSLAQRGEREGSLRLHDLQLDYIRNRYQDREALSLIHDAERLSIHILNNDPTQFASQMVGRLMPHSERDEIRSFIELLIKGAPRPWIRPIWPTLDAPGAGILRTLSGHTDCVNGVAVSFEGKIAVSASSDQTIKVWNLESGRELWTFHGHSGVIHAVALSPDARQIISAARDCLKVWDLHTGEAVRSLEGHFDSVTSVTTSADGRLIVSGSADKTLKVWDIETGSELLSLVGHSGTINSVSVDANFQLAVSASSDKTLKVWDLRTGSELFSLVGHADVVDSVAVSPDGRSAISASRDNTLKVWDLKTGEELRTLQGHSDGVRSVAVTADGRHAVSASWDHTIRVWDLRSYQAIRTLSGHYYGVAGIALSGDGQRAVAAYEEGTLKVWDLQSTGDLRNLPAHSTEVAIVAGCSDGKQAISVSRSSVLKLWDLETRRDLWTLDLPSRFTLRIAVSANGTIGIMGSHEQALTVWDVIDKDSGVHSLGHGEVLVDAVAVSGDGALGITAQRGVLKIWDLRSYRLLGTVVGHPDYVVGLAMSADGRRAVSGSYDNTIKLWDLETGQALCTFTQARIQALAISSDGRRAISASVENALTVWNLESRRESKTLVGHTESVTGLAMSSDGSRAVSGSFDRTLKVWDVANGATLATFTADATPICCGFINDSTIIAGDEAGRVHLLALE